MTIVVSGILVEVIKKDIKNMRLCIKPPDGRVEVSVPLIMPFYEIEQFVRSKENWIKSHTARFENQSLKKKTGFATGQDFFVWGKKYELQLEFGKKNSLQFIKNKAILTVIKKNNDAQREKFVREWYKKQLINEIELLLPKWEKKTKLKCESWNTRYMTSRWGSCKPKKRKLCFNIQLAKKPKECLEYIILHELLHIEERYHNDRFYSLIAQFMPKWKNYKSKLV